jgi:hypothetical protein
MYMKDWIAEIDDFAERYGKGILVGPGTVSHNSALAKAEAEYEKYRKRTVNELTPAEKDYLATIKGAQKKLEKKKK